MPGVAPNGPCYRFGPFELNTGEELLSRNGARVKIQDLPYRLLVMLLERPGEIVTREEVRRPSESAQSRLTKLVESCRARGYVAIANSASAVLATSKTRTS
jgi:DNA-binding winged helix-turn-helix (wHTH) protein